MKTYFATAAFLIAGLAALTTANMAQAATAVLPPPPPPPLVADVFYDFVGECADCSGYGVAHLSLFHYDAGNPLTLANFVSFVYDGSNLFPGGFSITHSSMVANPSSAFLLGTIPGSLPAPFHFFINDGINFFGTDPDGTWGTGRSGPPADFGINGSWTVANNATAAAVPEPAMIALLGIGLAGLGFSRRRIR